MAKTDVEPKTVWSCDRCGCSVEMRRTDVLPRYWRRWSKCDEHNVLMTELHLCGACSNIVDVATAL